MSIFTYANFRQPTNNHELPERKWLKKTSKDSSTKMAQYDEFIHHNSYSQGGHDIIDHELELENFQKDFCFIKWLYFIFFNIQNELYHFQKDIENQDDCLIVNDIQDYIQNIHSMIDEAEWNKEGVFREVISWKLHSKLDDEHHIEYLIPKITLESFCVDSDHTLAHVLDFSYVNRMLLQDILVSSIEQMNLYIQEIDHLKEILIDFGKLLQHTHNLREGRSPEDSSSEIVQKIGLMFTSWPKLELWHKPHRTTKFIN